MYNIKTAVAGAGFIGPVHVEALKRLGVTVTGVVGADHEESKQAKDRLNLPKDYASFAAMLNDDSVDVVHLAVPNYLHFKMAKRALQAGKHVMCEKPLAMDSEETTELVELAEKSGLHAGVCYNIRFYPLNLEARDRIGQGELGPIHSVMGSYVQDWLLYDTDYNWRVLADQGGALRAIADIGTHWMDLIISVTGLEVESVFADLKTVHKTRRRPKGEVETFSGKQQQQQELETIDIDTEDAGAVMFRFRGGGHGVLWVSQMTAGRKNCLRYEIAGAKNALAWNSESPNELWIGRRDTANGSLLRDPGLLGDFARPYAPYPGGHNMGFPDTFVQCFRAFYDRISGKTDGAPYPTFEEGHKEVLLCEAILKSHQEEKWVKL